MKLLAALGCVSFIYGTKMHLASDNSQYVTPDASKLWGIRRRKLIGCVIYEKPLYLVVVPALKIEWLCFEPSLGWAYL